MMTEASYEDVLADLLGPDVTEIAEKPKPKRKPKVKKAEEPVPTLTPRLTELFAQIKGVTKISMIPSSVEDSMRSELLRQVRTQSNRDRLNTLFNTTYPGSWFFLSKEELTTYQSEIKKILDTNGRLTLNSWLLYSKGPLTDWTQRPITLLDSPVGEEEMIFIYRPVLEILGQIPVLHTSFILHAIPEMTDFFGEENVKVYVNDTTAKHLAVLYPTTEQYLNKVVFSWKSSQGRKYQEGLQRTVSLETEGRTSDRFNGTTMVVDIFFPKITCSNEKRTVHRDLVGVHFVYVIRPFGTTDTFMYREQIDINMWSHQTFHPHARCSWNWWAAGDICIGSSRIAELRGDLACDAATYSYADHGSILSTIKHQKVSDLPSTWEELITHMIANTYGYVSAQSDEGVPYYNLAKVSNTTLFHSGQQRIGSQLITVFQPEQFSKYMYEAWLSNNMSDYVASKYHITPGFNGKPVTMIHKQTGKQIIRGIPVDLEIKDIPFRHGLPQITINDFMTKFVDYLNMNVSGSHLQTDILNVMVLTALEMLNPPMTLLSKRAPAVRLINQDHNVALLPNLTQVFVDIDWTTTQQMTNFLKELIVSSKNGSMDRTTYLQVRTHLEQNNLLLHIDSEPKNWYHPSQLSKVAVNCEVWLIRVENSDAFQKFLGFNELNIDNKSSLISAIRSSRLGHLSNPFLVALVLKPIENVETINLTEYGQTLEREKASGLSVDQRSWTRLLLSHLLSDTADHWCQRKFASGRFRQEHREISNPSTSNGFHSLLV